MPACQTIGGRSLPGPFHQGTCIQLAEIGIIHEGKSKSADQFRDQDFDLVVTVCDDAAENCPVWLGKGKRVHLGFPDPAMAQGTDEEKLAVFRSVRDAIAQKVPDLLRQM